MTTQLALFNTNRQFGFLINLTAIAFSMVFCLVCERGPQFGKLVVVVIQLTALLQWGVRQLMIIWTKLSVPATTYHLSQSLIRDPTPFPPCLDPGHAL
jgi:hypothetical protein